MRMKRSFIYLFILMLLGTASTAFGQNGEIYGTVTDETNMPFGGVIVKVTQGGLTKGNAVTDDDGTYSVKPLTAGTYDIEFKTMSYATKRVESVIVTSGGSTKVKMKMTIGGNDVEKKGVTVIKYKTKIADKVDAKTGEQIAKMPTRNILDAVSLSVNVQQSRNGGAIRIGGAREDGTVVIVDGIQVPNGGPVNPAQGTVDQLQVFSSGIPANLGDATGGVISITTKGLSSKTRGTVQAQHSVDGYNQNLMNASFSGPLVSRKRDGDAGIKEPVLGYLAGFDYQYDQDDNPTFVKNPILNQDVLTKLQNNPLTLVNTSNGTQLVSSVNNVSKDDFTMQKQQKNNSTTTIRFNGKLDYALNDNINITAGGSLNYNNSQGYNRAASYFAPESIPTQIGYTARGFVRFKQSFKSATTDTAKHAMISNAFYTLQLDYQMSSSQTQSPDFKRNLFDYGYVGKFSQTRVPVYQFGTDTASGRQGITLLSYDQVAGIKFEAADKNRILANYTKAVYDNANSLGFLSDYTQVQRYGGMMNGDFPLNAVSVQNATLSNIGAGLTGYSYGTFSQVGLHADASFDFKATPKSKTTHAIQFGLYYEQRSQSNYGASINPNGTGNTSLWNLMYQLANRHIGGLDYANPIFVHNGVQYTKAQVDAGSFFLPTDTILYNRLDNGTQSVFDANLRSKLGAGKSDYLDIYAVDPSKLSLDMFSADELLNQGSGFVSYNGYDYTGKKLSNQPNFNDFFTAKDALGRLTRPIGAFNPNYIAGYVMDKFRFEDMNFNIGVRIDRYDNNTKVLKDPYSLYELNTKGNVSGARNLDMNGEHPANIGENYAVYVNSNASATPTIIGYRNGDKWYSSTGVELPDPAVLKDKNGGSDPQPYLTTDGKVNISSGNFDPTRSFTDYKPKVTASPRFQFDFPIMDDKGMFYAHYDILVQRPKTGNYATPLDYMYLDRNSGSIIGNPDLKPEKTFDYELGYQQKISNNSGIGISAFYRERKDMIQVRPYLYAWPRTYYTYGNRDFSTTKGFTFKYDYRKPQNGIPIEMTLAYTLQFADGTGSNASSSNGGNGTQVSGSGLMQNFISAGLPNLRYVAPLSYDSRHNINLNVNYSYDDNEGPSINGKHFLQNFNANIIMRARSGEPYTTYQNVIGNAIQGGLNGTRLNWHFGIDLRLDKRFALNGFTKKNAAGEEVASNVKTKYYLAAFVYFQNIFNIKDVLGVYPYTSRPDDDGYVTSATGKQYFNTQYNAQTMSALYAMYVNNPGFYNGPRRANIGVAFSF
jgi:hypothetical protein